jgi:glycosyltransferase involved in cell wall biosynthesis
MKAVCDNMAKISIIIPVYNTGKYLYKCLKSVLSQTHSDLEVIMVDDGSDAETACICDEIASMDSRVRLVHKQNEGVSIARNIGIDMALGTYIGFVDSDDWVNADMYETLICEMEKYEVDIVMCDATTVWNDGRLEVDSFVCLSDSCTLSKSELTPTRQLELAGSSCRVLYRTRQLKTFGIRFPEGLKFSEDRIFNMIALGTSSRFRYIKKSFYNRYMREGSCVNTFHEDFVSVTLRVNEVMNDVLRRYWGENYIPLFEQRNLRSIGNHTVNLFLLDNMSMSARWKAVERICMNQQLQDVLKQQPCLDFPLRQIMVKNIYVLFFLSLKERLKNIIRKLVKR